ncbi:MAG: hypothetical protein KatS3mg115_0074 [Candidatus Poribacteria bacterium]|nr:MAG: hypothetical protein KatS3mg115_0074 [Candidatus Poribacteria bacterium]
MQRILLGVGSWILAVLSAFGQATSTFEQLRAAIFEPNCVSGSCHSEATQAGDLSLEGPDAYEQLVGAEPANARAREKGWLRVTPGKPLQSFLMVKLLSPGPGMGQLMPRGTRGLPPNQILAIRRWIEAGAPREGVVPGMPDLSGRPTVPPEFHPPKPPERGVQLHLEPFTIQPGTEREVFFALPPLEETLYVNRIEVVMREGSHHFILYRIREGEVPVGRFRDLDPRSPQELEMLRREYIIGAQTPAIDVQFPPGVALKLPAGTRFDLNSHYVNLNGGELYANEFCATGPLTGEVYVNLYAIPESEVRHLLRPLFDVNEAIEVPYGERRTTTRIWRPDRDVYLLMLTSHMHRHGVRYTAELLSTGERIYENRLWFDPVNLWFDPPLLVRKGDGIRHSATHENFDNPKPLRWGLTSEDEMAILIGYYYSVD